MKFSKFSELVNRILLNRILSNNHSHRRDMDVTIVIHSPGSIGSTPSVEVQSIHAGFDWDSGKVLIFPAQPLTTLTPEQITDITDSVRKGQSWHAYQEYKKHKEQLEKLSIELDTAKQRIAELEGNRAALAAENAGLKSGAMDEIKVINRGGQAYCVKDGVQINPMYARGWNDYRAKSLQSDTPATDAFLAEVRAQGVEMAMEHMQSSGSLTFGDCYISLNEFADQLRKGGNQ
ncbi:hypothetical protein POW86_07675 [Escherichia coli]